MESSAAGFSPSAIVTACMKPDHVIMSRFYADVSETFSSLKPIKLYKHVISKKWYRFSSWKNQGSWVAINMLTCSIVLLYEGCKVHLRTNNYQSRALFFTKNCQRNSQSCYLNTNDLLESEKTFYMGVSFMGLSSAVSLVIISALLSHTCPNSE